MANTRELIIYLKADNVKDGDVITFTDAGEIVDKEFQGKNGKEKKKVLEMSVSINGEKKIYSPNLTTRTLLEKEWGYETEDWVGKKATITIVPTANGNNMILAKPIK